jgi:hypothetical protein
MPRDRGHTVDSDDPTPRYGNDAPLMLEPDPRAHRRTPAPLGVPIYVADQQSRRTRSDTGARIEQAHEAAEGAAELAERINRELQPFRDATRSAKRWARGALVGTLGGLFAVVMGLRSDARDAGAAAERQRALVEEVRYLRARLDGQPPPAAWLAPPRAAPAAPDPSKGPPP